MVTVTILIKMHSLMERFEASSRSELPSNVGQGDGGMILSKLTKSDSSPW